MTEAPCRLMIAIKIATMERTMSQVSIAEAKNHLPRLVQQAEAGEPVRITRRGKPVAVLLSEQEFERLTGRGGFADFLRQWRLDMEKTGCEFVSQEEMEDLRDNASRKPSEWD